MTNITDFTLLELVNKIKKKEISSKEITKAYVDRSKKSKKLNAYVTENFTINSGVTLFFLNHQKGLRVKSGDITITNRGTLHSYEDDETATNQTITGTGTDGAYDIKIYNYGTIYNEGFSAIFVPNNDQDNDGDGIGPYIYNEGTIKTSNKWTIRFHASDKTKN